MSPLLVLEEFTVNPREEAFLHSSTTINPTFGAWSVSELLRFVKDQPRSLNPWSSWVLAAVMPPAISNRGRWGNGMSDQEGRPDIRMRPSLTLPGGKS